MQKQEKKVEEEISTKKDIQENLNENINSQNLSSSEGDKETHKDANTETLDSTDQNTASNEKPDTEQVNNDDIDITIKNIMNNLSENNKKIADKDNVILELKQNNKDLQEKLLRQLAETENLRNRSTKSIQEARDYAIFDFSKDLISVMDNFNRALEYIPQTDDQEVINFIEGIKMTKTELSNIFKKHLLEIIDPQTGESFDYNKHHAISQIQTDEYAPNSIVNVMQIGYKIKDRLIRPATVAVSKGE